MTLPCRQSPLVEALHDGRVAGLERSRVERHLATCGPCQALARDLEAIQAALRVPREEASSLEHQRQRQALLVRASTGSSLPPPARLSFAVPPRVLVPLAAALVAGSSVAAAAGWIGARLTAAPARPAASAPAPMASSAALTIKPSGGARFDHTQVAGLHVLTLSSGTIEVQLEASIGPQLVVVRTSDAEIMTSAGAFRVDAEGGHVRQVTVDGQAVELHHAGSTTVIPSGGSWQATGDALGAAGPPPADATEAARPRDARDEAEPSSTQRRLSEPSPSAAAEGETVAPSVTAPTAPGAGEPRGRDDRATSLEFARAIEALGRGDYPGGAAQLETFASAHPGDPRADDADYARAVALQRAGRRDEAVAAAKRYLATRPTGAHRAQAARIAGQ
jgi:hypothetical protein